MKAIKDIWIVGDSFLQEVHKVILDICKTAREDKAQMPYIFDYYNVKFFTEKQLHPQKNVMACIINSLIEVLNENKTTLLRYLLIMPDADIMKFIDFYTYGVSTITGKCLSWMITTIKRIIEARKDELRKCKPGAIAANEPKIFWLSMMNKPGVQLSDLYTVREKYNTILKDLLALRKHHYLININDVVSHRWHFISNKYMNVRGKERMWGEIVRSIEEFDYNKNSVNISPAPTQIKQQHQSSGYQRKPIMSVKLTNEAAEYSTTSRYSTTQYQPNRNTRDTRDNRIPHNSRRSAPSATQRPY